MGLSHRKLVYAAVGSAAVLVIVLLCLRIAGGGQYERRAAEGSRARKEAELIVQQIARNPGRVGDYVSVSASDRARRVIDLVTQSMATWDSPRVVRAEWFGDFLRVRVAGTAPDGGAVDRYLFMREEGGELRITGVQN